MKILIWQWGRRGAGPRYAAWLADALREATPGTVALSLSAQAEILRAPNGPICELPFTTYDGLAGFATQWVLAPLRVRSLAALVRVLRPDIALCAMPAPLDLFMAFALKRLNVPFGVVVHDASAHPGDGLPLQMTLQRALMRRADAIVTLSSHVEGQLRERGDVLISGGQKPVLVRSRLPPFAFGPKPPPPRSHGGPLRLLSFGRLLPYKGLDLLAQALSQLGTRDDLEVRVVGSGPESQVLSDLRSMPGITVENRWVPEAEIGDLIAWSDALVLSHKEASQSGAAAAAIAAGRFLIATRVGGLTEQLAGNSLARLCEPSGSSLSAAIASLLESGSSPVSAAADVSGAWQDAALGIVRDMAPLLVKNAGAVSQ